MHSLKYTSTLEITKDILVNLSLIEAEDCFISQNKD